MPRPAAAAGRPVARRTRVVSGPDGASSGELLQLGLAADVGPAVALIFDGDVWAADTVALLSGGLRDHDVVYTDEDRIDADGHHVDPRLKPAYSPDFLLSSAYVGRPVAARSRVLAGLALEAHGVGAIEHEWALHACGGAATVHHLSEVLCHRTGPAITPFDQHRTSRRRSGDATTPPASNTDARPGTFRIVRSVPGHHGEHRRPVPRPGALPARASSVRATARGVGHELILVDNGSVEPETRSLVEELAEREGRPRAHGPAPVQLARLNNEAVAGATGNVLVFLNNDIEVRESGWLEALCAQADRARTWRPPGRGCCTRAAGLQHCGIVVGLTGAAGHPLLGLAEDEPGYLQMATAAREWPPSPARASPHDARSSPSSAASTRVSGSTSTTSTTAAAHHGGATA